MKKGKIVAKLAGYGFVNEEGGDDYFFHKTSLEGGFFNALEVGQWVTFEPDPNDPKGPSCKAVYPEDFKLIQKGS